MHKVKKGKELVVTLTNRVGTGTSFFNVFKEADVNVVASSCFQSGQDVHFSLVPDNIEKALEIIDKNSFTTDIQDVLLVEMPNEPGAFAQLLQDIADMGVNVRSAYATTSVKERALAVLVTDNDDKVAKELE